MTTERRKLIADVEAALDQDPAGTKGQALAARWMSLAEKFTAGNPDLIRGVKTLYADAANWPSDSKEQMQPLLATVDVLFHIGDPVRDFINKAVAGSKDPTLFRRLRCEKVAPAGQFSSRQLRSGWDSSYAARSCQTS